MTKDKRAKTEARRRARERGIPYVMARDCRSGDHVVRLEIALEFVDSVLALVAALARVPPVEQVPARERVDLQRAAGKIDRLIALAVGDVQHGNDHLSEMKEALNRFISAAAVGIGRLSDREVVLRRVYGLSYWLPEQWNRDAIACVGAVAYEGHEDHVGGSYTIEVLPAAVVIHAALIQMGREGVEDVRGCVAGKGDVAGHPDL